MLGANETTTRVCPPDVDPHPQSNPARSRFCRAPTAGSSGQPIAIRWVVTNTGTVATRTTSWIDAAYLSADTTLDTDTDALVGAWLHSGALHAGQTYARTESPNLPNGVEGEFYLYLVADIHQQVNDWHRANNAGYVTPPISVTLSASPDLQPAAINPPADA
jgi:hypothetical protein